LIELLVVTSIITILISILVPSLSRAREQAKQLICRNNFRNIWTGVLQYAYANRDRVPFMEDVNLSDPNADPFDPQYKSSVGTMLSFYVHPGSWKCPSAIRGFPQDAGPERWKMTYWFRTAGKFGEGVPFDKTPHGRAAPRSHREQLRQLPAVRYDSSAAAATRRVIPVPPIAIPSDRGPSHSPSSRT
jgi:type II secretory pathway pseudopilin PulG